MNQNFIKNKVEFLNRLDLSKKGSIDGPIKDIIKLINDSDHYYTTSSCSGRIIVISQSEQDYQKKKGCQWIFVSHTHIDDHQEVIKALINHEGSAVLKFEPFILHATCATIDHAMKVNRSAIDSGFRNSGISVGQSGRVTVAVRSTHSLEIPISCNGSVLVSEEYIEYIVKKANDKLKENLLRIDKFYLKLKNILMI